MPAMLLPVPAQLGYPALGVLVFGESAGLPLPGETALLTAGGLAAGGHLALPLVVLVAATAAIAGDTVGYWLGRRGGRAFLLRDGFLAAHRRHAVARADRFFDRYGAATVFCGRWVPGLRVVAALMAGATRMPWRRFAVANALGAFAWAATVASLAAVLGPTGSLILAAAGLGLAAIAAAVGSWRRRHASRRRPAAVAGLEAGLAAGPRPRLVAE
jgi:membrane protein DedA with SNARE-associated domain